MKCLLWQSPGITHWRSEVASPWERDLHAPGSTVLIIRPSSLLQRLQGAPFITWILLLFFFHLIPFTHCCFLLASVGIQLQKSFSVLVYKNFLFFLVNHWLLNYKKKRPWKSHVSQTSLVGCLTLLCLDVTQIPATKSVTFWLHYSL